MTNSIIESGLGFRMEKQGYIMPVLDREIAKSRQTPAEAP